MSKSLDDPRIVDEYKYILEELFHNKKYIPINNYKQIVQKKSINLLANIRCIFIVITKFIIYLYLILWKLLYCVFL